MDIETAVSLSDANLIRRWRRWSLAIDRMVDQGTPTMDVARDLGYVEREMERRGIRHDDPRGEVLDSHGVWHQP